jgi:small-conductance mechanosensitive channel
MINAYIKEPNKQAVIYSDLHQNIQDVCNERGIEIMSPHYRAAEMETGPRFLVIWIKNIKHLRLM